MPKRTRKPGPDAVQDTRRVLLGSKEAPGADPSTFLPLAPATHKSLISQVMAEMGRKGGLIGGKRRLETLSDRRRNQIAKQAARARWSKKK